jgi:hypothetical protein
MSSLPHAPAPWATNLGTLSGAMKAAESAAAASILDDSGGGFDPTADELQLLLQSLNLSHLRATLDENEVDISSLKLMSENDLQEIGIAKGPRIKIMKRVQAELYGFAVGNTGRGGQAGAEETASVETFSELSA